MGGIAVRAPALLHLRLVDVAPPGDERLADRPLAAINAASPPTRRWSAPRPARPARRPPGPARRRRTRRERLRARRRCRSCRRQFAQAVLLDLAGDGHRKAVDDAPAG